MNKVFKCEGLDHFGRGITYYKEKIVFVDNFLPNEKAELIITKEKKNYYEAEVKQLLIKSDLRENVLNDNLFKSKISPLLHMKYKLEKDFKVSKVKELLLKFANINVLDIKITTNEELYYRNKVSLKVENKQLAYNISKTNKLINIDESVLVVPVINKSIKLINEYLKKNDQFDSVVIRANELEELMFIIIGKLNKANFINELSSLNIKSIILNNDLIYGNDYLAYKLFDKEIRVYGNSFYQVNQYQIENLFGPIIKYVQEKNISNALDLFCGSGVIGLLISDYVNNIIGIDSNKKSIISANFNKELNNVENIEFIHDEVENRINDFNNLDLIIFDPPRKGLDMNTKNHILNIQPNHVIYVSCDPSTLSRDLNLLKAKYEIKDIKLIDMFPKTYHIETIVFLQLKQEK